MLGIRSLDGDAQRDAIDARDRFLELRDVERELTRRYDGSMFYETRGQREYLLRRHAGSSAKHSLGPRSDETDRMLAEFQKAQDRLTSRRSGLRHELERMAPVLAARGLGRVPKLAARILRRMDDVGWMGTRLHVVGTHALFAYEALAGVRVSAEATATGDVDLLYDARRRIRLGGSNVRDRSVLGLLRRVDKSFNPSGPHAFRAINDQGYMVDLIGPVHDLRRGSMRTSQVENLEDAIGPVEIDGLDWLVNAPKTEAVAFDEKGLPLLISTVDPRAFALHKLWVAERHDRDPLKRRRDRGQAEIAANIAVTYLGLRFDDQRLSALPQYLLAGIETIQQQLPDREADDDLSNAW
jgi:hypothetical protein